MNNKHTYIACASVVTKKSFKEFLLLDYTISQYHNVKWYLSTDPVVFEKLSHDEKYICLKNIETDENANHCGADNSQESKQKFMDIMKTKAYACLEALEQNEEFVLFLDSDIFFVNPIEEKLLSLFKNKSIDAFLCPHSTFNHANEATVGFFNAGMYCTNSIQFLKTWIEINDKALEYGMYGDQKPLEYIYFNFTTANLPINYDIGFWRMNESNQMHAARFNSLTIDQHSNIRFCGHLAVCFHAHTFKNLTYPNYGAKTVERVLLCLNHSKRKDHKNILKYMAQLSLKTKI